MSASKTPQLKFAFRGDGKDLQRVLPEVANNYRGEGYRVILNPGPDDLPPFLKGFHIGLIALKDDEKAVVEVKLRTEDIGKDTQILQLGSAIDAQTDWRLDLVVLNPGGGAPRIAPDAFDPPTQQILQNLASAERLASSGELAISYVLSWAALEAAMRHAVRAIGRDPKDADAPSLLRALYSEGPLDREDFDRLKDSVQVRNALVRGLALPSIDPDMPQYLTDLARKLLSHNGKASEP